MATDHIPLGKGLLNMVKVILPQILVDTNLVLDHTLLHSNIHWPTSNANFAHDQLFPLYIISSASLRVMELGRLAFLCLLLVLTREGLLSCIRLNLLALTMSGRWEVKIDSHYIYTPVMIQLTWHIWSLHPLRALWMLIHYLIVTLYMCV